MSDDHQFRDYSVTAYGRMIEDQRRTGPFVDALRQAVRGKNFVVADILNDWQQAPVEKGDVVFF